MRLVSVADIRERKKKLAVASEIDAAVDDAIEGATVLLEGKLNTVFAQTSLTHTYRVNLIESPPTGQLTELALDRGFVDAVTRPVLVVADRIEDLNAGVTLTEGAEFHVKNEEGIILVDNADAVRFGAGLRPSSGGVIAGLRGLGENFFVRLTYTAGLTNTAGLFDNVPAWLKEAAVVATIIILEQQSPVTKKEFGDKLTPHNQTAWNHLLAILDRKSRFFGSAIKPLF